MELNALTITEENDGVINPGEDVGIEIMLENVTPNIAENVTGELSCIELEIIDGDIFFQEILPMSVSDEGDGSVSVQIPIDIVISEEEIIPEEKIISNERDQTNDLFNEMTEHRTLLSYEELFCSDLPYPLNPDRKEEWLNLVENSWCNYYEHGYREWKLPFMAQKYGTNDYVSNVERYLEKWKK